MKKIVWIVGGSSGIGYELSTLYLKNDYKVIVSSRNATKTPLLQELRESYKNNITLIDMDVIQTQSVDEATQEAWKAYGEINLCIYNAGVYESMKVDEWKINSFEQMMQINYLGAVRVTNALTPFFIQNGRGCFVYNSSISSYFGLPYGGGYSAPKAALLNFCESIQPELEAKNIDIRVINHGFVKTRLTDKNEFEMPQLLEASEAAKIIYDRLSNTKGFEIKFPFALSTFLYFLKVIPYKLAFYFTKKAL
jgi:short-subunit dehydrogenase